MSCSRITLRVNQSRVIRLRRGSTSTVTGSDQHGEHVQSVAAATWTVNHNFGWKPVVKLYSLGGVEFDGTVQHLSNNHFQVQLDTAATGIAVYS